MNNPKNQLQEYCQKNKTNIPQYKTIRIDKNNDHEPIWKSVININNIALEQATLMNRLDMVHHFHSYSDVDKNNSCLQIACKYGFIDIIYYLDSIGYKLSDELLYIAAKYGHEHIVRFLVRSGIDVRSNNDIALEVSQYQYPNIAIFLINQGSHVELSYFSHGDITHWLVKNNLYDKDKFGTQVYDRYIS